MKKTITPRPLPIAIAAVLAAVAMPGAFALVMLTANGFRLAGTPASHLGEVVSLLGGSGVIIGWPIALLLRRLGRHSVLANVAGFLTFVAIASIYPSLNIPGYQDWDSEVNLFAGHLLIFAIYGVLSVSIALLIGRIFGPRPQPSVGELSDIFE
jgi:hypothetical protein